MSVPLRVAVPSAGLSLEQIKVQFASLLQTDFALPGLSPYSIVVEGHTDRLYLEKAVELQLAADGEDLLAVPMTEPQDRILVCTPGTGTNPNRGGTPQMVRLARALQPYVFTLDMFKGLMFVFDHDDAGLSAQSEIAKFGYRQDYHSITLDPRLHPTACATKQVVVEDLLSLQIQTAFFDSAPATCSIDYERGNRVRFKWAHESKASLCEYVRASGVHADFRELINLLRRVRSIFGFPS